MQICLVSFTGRLSASLAKMAKPLRQIRGALLPTLYSVRAAKNASCESGIPDVKAGPHPMGVVPALVPNGT